MRWQRPTRGEGKSDSLRHSQLPVCTRGVAEGVVSETKWILRNREFSPIISQNHRIDFIHAKKEGSTTISIKYLYFFSLRNNFGYSKIYRVFYSLFIHAAWRDSVEIKMFRDDRKEADRTNLLIARLIVKRGAENQACGYRTCSNI